MSHSVAPFQGPKLKLDRALRHRDDLRERVDNWIATKPLVLRLVHGPNLHTYELRLSVRDQVPLDFSLIFGDSIHNLRAALDFMANDLVELNVGRHISQVSFPFCRSLSDLDRVIKRSKFARAGDPALQLLRKIAPHKSGNWALQTLHELDIQDKHKTIVPAVGSVRSSNFEVMFDHGYNIELMSHSMFNFRPAGEGRLVPNAMYDFFTTNLVDGEVLCRLSGPPPNTILPRDLDTTFSIGMPWPPGAHPSKHTLKALPDVLDTLHEIASETVNQFRDLAVSLYGVEALR